jgi:hypothetical protein
LKRGRGSRLYNHDKNYSPGASPFRSGNTDCACPFLNVLARDVAAISTHLRVFCAAGYCLRQGLARTGCSAVGRTGIPTKARPRRFGRVRRSCTISPCLRLLQKITPPLPMSFPQIPRCVSRARVLLVGYFFCLWKWPQMAERGLGFTISVAIRFA